MIQYIPTPIFDVPFKSDWRKNIESMFGLPDCRNKEVVKTSQRMGKNRLAVSYKTRSENSGTCSNCPKAIGPRNVVGMCKMCYQRESRRVKKGGPLVRAKCSHDGCEKLLIRTNRSGLCGWHNPDNARRDRFQKAA